MNLQDERTSSGEKRWIRIDEMPHKLSRSQVYRMINAGVITSVNLTLPGSKKGVRLVDLVSYEAYLDRLLNEQSKEPQYKN